MLRSVSEQGRRTISLRALVLCFLIFIYLAVPGLSYSMQDLFLGFFFFFSFGMRGLQSMARRI